MTPADRGDRVLALVDSIIAVLMAEALLGGSRDDARVALFHVLADDLYGNAPIDIPPLRRERKDQTHVQT